jgi:hypothetical protein
MSSIISKLKQIFTEETNYNILLDSHKTRENRYRINEQTFFRNFDYFKNFTTNKLFYYSPHLYAIYFELTTYGFTNDIETKDLDRKGNCDVLKEWIHEYKQYKSDEKSEIEYIETRFDNLTKVCTLKISPDKTK